jgi:hypothetical protein
MHEPHRFSPAQCRGGRGLLDWTADALARRAGVPAEAVELYEAGESSLTGRELQAVGLAFAAADVTAFTWPHGGEGLLLSRPRTRFAPANFNDLPSPERAELVAEVARETADACRPSYLTKAGRPHGR